MFITAGSCSVMLLWPTRRIFFCHGWVAGSIEGIRGGSGMSFGVDKLTAARTTSSAEGLEAGSRVLSAAVIGMTAALLLRKVRRLSISIPLIFSTREVVDNGERCTTQRIAPGSPPI